MQNPLPPIDIAAPVAEAFDFTLKRLALLLRVAEGAWVLAVYRNPTVRQAVTEKLRARVAPLRLVTISLAQQEPDLLAILDQAGEAAGAPVVCFTDLRAAGSRLIRSLDLEREALARLPHRLVFWVTEAERGQLATRAPNFYSRLSGTFRFLDVAERALELAPGVDPHRGAPELAAAAPGRLLEELTDAYIADDWGAVLRLARRLAAAAPPQVASWVRLARSEVPIAVRVLPYHAGTMDVVTLTPDGRQALSGYYDGTLRLWNLATGQVVHTFTIADWPVRAVAVTPDGRQALSGSFDGTLSVWNLVTGRGVHTFGDHAGVVTAVAVTPDGRQALSGYYDGTLRLWDLATGQSLRAFTGYTGRVNAVAVTPDGRQALSGAEDRTLRLWDLTTGQSLRAFMGHTRGVNAVAVTPDGRQALSGAADRTLRLWDLTTGQNVRVFSGHTGGVNAVAMTPDGRQAFSGSEDWTLRLWDLASGQELRTLTDHTREVRAVAITPDGHTLVSGGMDGTVRVWTLPEGFLG